MSNDQVKVEESKQLPELLASVTDKIKSIRPAVRERVVASMVEKELVSRADTLERALVKLKDCAKEIAKIKPDQETYTLDENKKPVKSVCFSKAKYEELKKAEEKRDGIEAMIETVLSSKTEDGKLKEAFNKLAEALK